MAGSEVVDPRAATRTITLTRVLLRALSKLGRLDFPRAWRLGWSSKSQGQDGLPRLHLAYSPTPHLGHGAPGGIKRSQVSHCGQCRGAGRSIVSAMSWKIFLQLRISVQRILRERVYRYRLEITLRDIYIYIYIYIDLEHIVLDGQHTCCRGAWPS